MGRFKLWLERRLWQEEQMGGINDDADKIPPDKYKDLARLYHMTLKALGVQGSPNAYALTKLQDLNQEDGKDGGIPHIHTALTSIISQLTNSPGFEELGKATEKFFKTHSNPRPDGTLHKPPTIGDLLQAMFGSDALQMYGEGKWKMHARVGKQGAEQQSPQDQVQAGKPGTAPPMADQLGGGAGGPGGDPAGGAGGPGGPGGPGGGPGGGAPGGPMGDPMGGMGGDPTGGMGGMPDPSMGGMPPDPSMGGMPPDADPTQALQSPGGPMPPKPPGGLPMA
jgi:hypothetical protein